MSIQSILTHFAYTHPTPFSKDPNPHLYLSLYGAVSAYYNLMPMDVRHIPAMISRLSTQKNDAANYSLFEKLQFTVKDELANSLLMSLWAAILNKTYQYPSQMRPVIGESEGLSRLNAHLGEYGIFLSDMSGDDELTVNNVFTTTRKGARMFLGNTLLFERCADVLKPLPKQFHDWWLLENQYISQAFQRFNYRFLPIIVPEVFVPSWSDDIQADNESLFTNTMNWSLFQNTAEPFNVFMQAIQTYSDHIEDTDQDTLIETHQARYTLFTSLDFVGKGTNLLSAIIETYGISTQVDEQPANSD